MKTFKVLLMLTMISSLNCSEPTTKLIDAVIITSDNMAASVATDSLQIDVKPTILEDGSIEMKLVIYEKK